MTAGRPLTDSERLDWIRLSRSENVGPITFFQLLQPFGTAAAALDAIPDPPPVLALVGHAHLTADPGKLVAVVGARNTSASGNRFARQLAAELGAAGVVVVSGLARGIDAAAHTGALGSGTVAVMAGGVDVPYPAENEALYRDIAGRGLLLSEQPFGVKPQARHFPRRNRLISGSAMGVVIVEAAPRSGSLITARMALEQGREVFAVPGSPLDPRCRGTNNLLRQGATLTESAADVIGALQSMQVRPLTEPAPAGFEGPYEAAPAESQLAAARAKVAELLGPTPIPVDELVRQSRLTPAIVLTILLELELAGHAERHPGNQVSTL